MSGSPGLTPLLNIPPLSVPLPPPDEGDPIVQNPVVQETLQPWVDLRVYLQSNSVWDPTFAFNWYYELDGTTFNIPSSSGSSQWTVKSSLSGLDGYTFNLCIINGQQTPGNVNWGADWILSATLASGFIAANPVKTRSVFSVVCVNTLHLSDDGQNLMASFSNITYPTFLCSGPTVLPPPISPG